MPVVGLQNFQLPDGIKGMILDRRSPTMLGRAGSEGDNLFHDLLPGAGEKGGIGGHEIGAGDLEIQMGLVLGFIHGMSQAWASTLSRVCKLDCLPVTLS